MLKHLATCLFGLGVVLCTLQNAAAEKRVALVIGNSAYQHTAPLRNPSNDASDVAAKLRELGFDVTDGIDLTKQEMEQRIRTFADKLQGSDIGLFYYAGHGLAVDGRNFLAPVDASLKSDTDIDFETVELNLVLKQMERNSRLSLVFLDACRNNPLAANLASTSRSLAVSRGLARVEKAVGMMIAFATRPDDVALDGEGRNSPFTGALLRHISEEGSSVNDLMIEVRNDVLKATDGKQVPWENSSLTGQFFFKPASQTAADKPADTSADIAALRDQIAKLQADQGARLQSQQDQLQLLQQQLAAKTKGAGQPVEQASAEAAPVNTPTAEPAPATNRVITVEPANAGAASPATSATLSAATSKAGANPSPAPEEPKVAAAESSEAAPPPGQIIEAPLPEGAARAELAADILAGLKELDCYQGRISGTWTNRSQDALARFNETSKLDLPVDAPEQATLDAIKGWKGPHCTVELAPKLHHGPAPKEVVIPRTRPYSKGYRANAQRQAPYRPNATTQGHGGDEINELQRLFPQTYQGH